MSDISYEQFLRCVSDPVTQVRDMDGNLLGCIPKVPEDYTSPFVSSPSGQNFELMVAALVVVRVDPKTHNPADLPGFVALDVKNMDLANPVTPAGGDDPDLGQPV